jgi:hypothetical protein
MCAISVVVPVLAAAGCGDDDEPVVRTATTPAPSTGTVDPAPTATREEPQPTEEAEPVPTTGEDAPEGAGDELPASSLALLTGRDGRITPRRVRVPAFISIRVQLRSADGARYALRFGRRTLRVGAELSSVSARFDGLRPGAALVGRPLEGAVRPVRIEATAEPGP